jgi:hypothetical protein
MAVVPSLTAKLNKSPADAAFAGRLRQIGVGPTPLTVATFDDFIMYGAGRRAETVKLSGARAE